MPVPASAAAAAAATDAATDATDAADTAEREPLRERASSASTSVDVAA
jgi:hypothetical protein